MEGSTMTPPAPLTATLVMTPEQFAQVTRETMALEVARAYTIDPAAPMDEQATIAVEANTELKSVKGRIATLEKLRDGFVAPALTIIENARNLFNPGLVSLKDSETFLKSELTSYQARVAEVAAAAERKRLADEREARQKAAQEAAAARAKAEEESRQKAAAAAEAEQQRLAAVRDGNAKLAREAAARKAKLDEQAAAAIESGEAKAQAVQLAASASTPASAPPVAPKLAGFSTRRNWGAHLAENVSEDAALERIIGAITGVPAAEFKRKDLLALVSLNWQAANKLAKAQESKMDVPGLVAKNNPSAASRG
jgi:flagellar biosynthesis GTPase FlhF